MWYQPHVVLLNEAGNPKPTHGVGSRCWHIVQMRYCLLLVCIRHYSSTGRCRTERKHTLISCVWRLVCLLSFNHIRKSYKPLRKVELYGKLRALGLFRREMLQGILTSLVVYPQWVKPLELSSAKCSISSAGFHLHVNLFGITWFHRNLEKILRCKVARDVTQSVARSLCMQRQAGSAIKTLLKNKYLDCWIGLHVLGWTENSDYSSE